MKLEVVKTRKRLPIKSSELLMKAKESCLLAVDIYNKPKTSFRSGAFIVLMTIAWTSLFHAIFEKKRIKYYHRDKSKKFIKIDGEYKTWELNDCLQKFFFENKKEDLPIRKNIEFFIPLRNKIEHRFMPELDSEIFGECQACLHNFELILVKEFGEKHSIQLDLMFSLQFAKNYNVIKKSNPHQDKSLEKIKKFISEFRGSLDDEVYKDQKYSFKIYLLPKLVNNREKADFAIEWINYDSSNPEEMKKYEHILGIIKEKIQPVSNYGLIKAGSVCKIVREELLKIYGIKLKFDPSSRHVSCCYYYKIRPTYGEPKEKTNKDFCIYDSAHNDYLYTESWVNLLKKNLADKETFLKLFPRDKHLFEVQDVK